MIDQVCTHVRNFFETDPITGARRIHQGRYSIVNGSISLPFLANGQYFRLFGSRFSDGVHQYPASALPDETFDGVVWDMRPPKDFLDLVREIEAWMQKYGEAANSPYQSEAVIGAYSYTKQGDGGSWQSVFKRRLDPYRNLF